MTESREIRDEQHVGLREILFPKRGISATELLLGANLIVAAVLLGLWDGNYRAIMLRWTDTGWNAVREHRAFEWFVPTLFMHAGPGHLARNMVGLLAGSGAAEFLVGSRWTLAAYLITGLGGAWASYLGHGTPPLSIGASGAVMGLVGCTVGFIIRRRRMFNYAQRWKVWRVYVPLFLLLFLPTLVNADVHAHAGGFACGIILGACLPPHARVSRLAAVDPLRDDDR
jgi:rhomboid protease GluP